MINMKTIITSLLLMASIGLSAQKPAMRTIFTNMPDTLLSHLSNGNRLDLVDFVESGMEAKVADKLGDSVVLSKLTPDYLFLRLSAASSVEMKILPYGGKNPGPSATYIICMVSTVGNEIKESAVRFYTTDWKPIEILRQLEFGPSDFIADTKVISDESIRFLIDKLCPLMISASLSPDTTDLTLKLSIPLISDEDKDKIKALYTPKILKWDGKIFK